MRSGMSPTHDLPRHRFGLLLLGLPPRMPVQIFQYLAVLPHVRVDLCRAHFLAALQRLPLYDLLPSSSVAIPARSSLTTAPAPRDESRRVLVLHQGLDPHPLPRAQLLVSLPRAPSRALAPASQSTPRMDFRMRLALRIIDCSYSQRNAQSVCYHLVSKDGPVEAGATQSSGLGWANRFIEFAGARS